MKHADNLRNVYWNPAGFTVLETAQTQSRIWFMGDGVVRLRTSFSRSFPEESLSLVRTAWEDRYDQCGEPILRPMVYEFPHDAKVRCEDVDFMLGDGILAACVVDKDASTRSVYLPENEVFYEFDTQQQYFGGQVITIPAPLDRTPLFQRGGSIIPLREDNTINLWICPDKACSFTMYEDDGTSNDYLNGAFRSSKYSLTKNGDLVTIRSEISGTYVANEAITFHVQCTNKAPSGIVWNKMVLPQFLDEDRFRAAESGWHYYRSTKVCSIKCGNGQNLEKLIVNFGQFELIRIDQD